MAFSVLNSIAKKFNNVNYSKAFLQHSGVLYNAK